MNDSLKMCQIFLFQLSPNNKTVFAAKYEFLWTKYIETDEIKINWPQPPPCPMITPACYSMVNFVIIGVNIALRDEKETCSLLIQSVQKEITQFLKQGSSHQIHIL